MVFLCRQKSINQFLCLFHPSLRGWSAMTLNKFSDFLLVSLTPVCEHGKGWHLISCFCILPPVCEDGKQWTDCVEAHQCGHLVAPDDVICNHGCGCPDYLWEDIDGNCVEKTNCTHICVDDDKYYSVSDITWWPSLQTLLLACKMGLLVEE